VSLLLRLCVVNGSLGKSWSAKSSPSLVSQVLFKFDESSQVNTKFQESLSKVYIEQGFSLLGQSFEQDYLVNGPCEP
jgi:predicted GNAT family N-acyltransferase